MDESQHESRRVSKARRGSSAAAAAATALEDDSDALGDADEEDDDDDEEEEGDETGAEEEEDEDEEEADEEEPNDEEDPESQSSPQSICLSVTVHQFLFLGCTNQFAIGIGSIDYLTDENSSQDWNEAEDPSDPSTHATANPASIKNPLLPGGAVTSSLKKKAQGLSLKIPKH